MDTASNGECEPKPLTKVQLLANRVALETATAISRKMRLPRDRFPISSAGAAAALLAFNEEHAEPGAHQHGAMGRWRDTALAGVGCDHR